MTLQLQAKPGQDYCSANVWKEQTACICCDNQSIETIYDIESGVPHRVTEKKFVQKIVARCFHNEYGLLSPQLSQLGYLEWL